MTEPLVSVLMPCWNARRTLPWALASLLSQSYANWECVLVDDGSTDDPRAVVGQAADARVRYISLRGHFGRGAARQRALDEARGDLVCMLDADDWLFPTKLRRQVDAMLAERRAGLVSTGMSIVNANNDIVGVRCAGPTQAELALRAPMKRLSAPPLAHAPSMLRRQQARKIRFDLALGSGEDVDYLIRFLFVNPFAVMADVSYVYTEHETATLPKIVDALGSTRRSFRKHRSRFPVSSRAHAVASLAKAAAYRVGFAAGYGERLVARRSSTPDEHQTHDFRQAREAVVAIVRRRFSGSAHRCAS
jgi:glycosyltransferase involved in cell wall biosynthesis